MIAGNWALVADWHWWANLLANNGHTNIHECIATLSITKPLHSSSIVNDHWAEAVWIPSQKQLICQLSCWFIQKEWVCLQNSDFLYVLSPSHLLLLPTSDLEMNGDILISTVIQAFPHWSSLGCLASPLRFNSFARSTEHRLGWVHQEDHHSAGTGRAIHGKKRFCS